MAITSQLRPAPTLGEVWLRHWREAGLVKPSAVKPIVTTLEQGLVVRKLGVLDPEDQDALHRSISRIIG